jgi:Protein of unknown function (DUF3102)
MSATILDLRTGVDKDAVAIGNLCSKARGSIVDSVKCLIEAGQKLTKKKESLGHGEWLPWLKENKDALGFSTPQTAGRLMKVGKLNVNAQFGETEAAQISRSVWGNTKPRASKKTQAQPRARTAKQEAKAREIVRPMVAAGVQIDYNALDKEHGISHVTFEKAAAIEIALLNETTEIDTLPKTAKDKLEIAKRMMQRKVEADHAARMHKLDEEVRQRVLKEGKEYLADLQKERDAAYKEKSLYQEMTNNRQHIFTLDQFNLIRKCLHQGGIAAKPKDFDAAFDLIQKKKLQLTGQK